MNETEELETLRKLLRDLADAVCNIDIDGAGIWYAQQQADLALTYLEQ